MENRHLAIPIAVILILVALIGIGCLAIKPNSTGVPGMLRVLALKTTRLAFSCERQAAIGEEIFLADEPGLNERAALAREWFTMALSCNAPAAQYYLGDMYLHGYGTRRNVDKGITYLEKSRRAGYREATWLLASIYHRGDIVPADIQKAISGYEACAGDGKNARRMQCGAGLAQLLALDIDPPQYERAYEWAKPAAQGGNALGQSVAAYLLYKGLGVKRDADKARLWAQSAAAQGEPFAYGTLAEIYLRGDGVPADKSRALGYLKQLEGVDAPWADRQLGYIFRDGIGDLPRDAGRSMQHFIKAAEKGDRKAAGEVGKIFYESIGTGGNFSEAFHWLTRAAEAGDGTAMLYLSRLYFEGVPQLGIAPSTDKGWLYLNEADKRSDRGEGRSGAPVLRGQGCFTQREGGAPVCRGGRQGRARAQPGLAGILPAGRYRRGQE